MSFINISAKESALPFALEQYYFALNQLIGERANQPILLNNTITTFDINEEAPFYSEGVFRLFADRKYSVSPDDLGTAIQVDSFSQQYEDVIKIASTQIDSQIDSETNRKIKNRIAEIRRVEKEIINYETTVNENWIKIAESEGLEPEDDRYNLRRINYLESIFYADVKEQFTSEIQTYRVTINALRASAYTPAQQKLLRSFRELAETYKIARPKSSQFEKTVPGVSILTFSDPTVRSKQLCHISPPSFPAGVDLVKFQKGNDNIRKITVDENTTHNELHTRTWSAGGGGSFNVFGMRLGGGGSSSGSSSYKKNFKSLKSFEMSFADIAEIYVDRGLWFDPSIFDNEELKPILDSVPGTRDLKYISVSLVIARGLTLTVNFDEELEEEKWKKEKFSARGGVSCFGYRFGGRGSRTTYDYDFKLSENKKTVTFKDDKQHCRLLAVRLEKIYHTKNNESQLFQVSEKFSKQNLDKLTSGNISYKEFQQDRVDSYNEK